MCHCPACREGKTNCCVRLKVLGVHVDGGLQDGGLYFVHVDASDANNIKTAGDGGGGHDVLADRRSIAARAGRQTTRHRGDDDCARHCFAERAHHQ